jgi:fructose-specific phosphotransferase system component IIB
MEILFAILAVTGFISGVGAVFMALYNSLAVRAQINEQMADIRIETLGIESRIEGALTRKQNAALLDMRQTVQSDALELVQNTLVAANDSQADLMGMANFNNFGE